MMSIGKHKDLGRFVIVHFALPLVAWSTCCPVLLADAPGNEKLQAVPLAVAGHDSPLPAGAVTRLGTNWLRHNYGLITRVAFSPDGQILASVGTDGTLRLWHRLHGKPGYVLGRGEQGELEQGAFRALAFSPDGRTIASDGPRCNVRLWDIARGKIIRELKGHRGCVNALAYSPKGSLLASSTQRDNLIRLWNPASGKEQAVLRGHNGTVMTLSFSPDGRLLASGSDDHSICLWLVSTGKLWRRIPLTEDVKTVAFSPSGNVLACCGDIVRIWDVATGKLLHRLRVEKASAITLGFSPDGKTLASADTEKQIHLWDIMTGKHIRTYFMDSEHILSLAFSPDGKTLATGCTDNSIRLWDVATGKNVSGRSVGHNQPISTVQYTPDGSRILTASNDGAARLWQAATARHLRMVQTHPSCQSIILSPDGKLFATADGESGIQICELTKGKAVRHFKADAGAVAFSPDGLLVAGQSRLDVTRLDASWVVTQWEISTGRQSRQFKLPHPSNYVHHPQFDFGACGSARPFVLFSPDGKKVAFLSGINTVHLWDTRTGKEIRHWNDCSTPPGFLAFSPDSRYLVAGGGGLTGLQLHPVQPPNDIPLWDVETGQLLHRFRGHKNTVNSIAFSPDSRLLASASEDGTLRLWEVATGEELQRLRDQSCKVHAVAFAPDGQTLASGMSNGTALIWLMVPANWRPLVDKLTAKQRETCWNDLAGSDAIKAQRAVWNLATTPADTIIFLKAHLHPVPIVAQDRIDQLIAHLDSDSFARREAASRELSRLGTVAESSLRKAVENSPSAEQRRRVETLLAALPAWVIKDPETLRVVRAIWVLQRIGTPEARTVLENLAAGAPAARQTQEAKAAVQYLDRIKKQ